jgi:hypothetical protein
MPNWARSRVVIGPGYLAPPIGGSPGALCCSGPLMTGGCAGGASGAGILFCRAGICPETRSAPNASTCSARNAGTRSMRNPTCEPGSRPDDTGNRKHRCKKTLRDRTPYSALPPPMLCNLIAQSETTLSYIALIGPVLRRTVPAARDRANIGEVMAIRNARWSAGACASALVIVGVAHEHDAN